ncbi:FAD-dependent oxidoreductase [Granulicella sp. dw_53]|uniref:NAD(P)/FAD-dependent oxidoreductase n=1 Tax=Granulicella sp. dw_53 TaxID=2719792 RepID=UPI001BD1C73E|nr:FAD-dependent oxidoreductase [Granulicella sp. dw_53]
MPHSDCCIAGAGIIGLSLALELHHRGATVTVLESGDPLAQASTAAAGMLAAHDPENPPQLQSISDLSLSLYPAYLSQIESLSGLPVPFQTSLTLQALPSSSSLPLATPEELPRQLILGNHHFHRIKEHSIDPRQLATALLAAVQATSVDLHSHTPVINIRAIGNSIQIETPTTTFTASHFIDCTGAWAATAPPSRVVPRKGQLLSVALPPTLPLDLVLRTPGIYIVPRTQGPNAGRAIIGATLEDRGFDKTVHPADIARLHSLASHLLPDLAIAPVLESWAGLRPTTPDGLPLLGAVKDNPRHLLATGHYRNGILLAPVTAHLIAQLLSNEPLSLDLSALSPARDFPVP